jgi:hypothetical protein
MDSSSLLQRLVYHSRDHQHRVRQMLVHPTLTFQSSEASFVYILPLDQFRNAILARNSSTIAA